MAAALALRSGAWSASEASVISFVAEALTGRECACFNPLVGGPTTTRRNEATAVSISKDCTGCSALPWLADGLYLGRLRWRSPA